MSDCDCYVCVLCQLEHEAEGDAVVGAAEEGEEDVVASVAYWGDYFVGSSAT